MKKILLTVLLAAGLGFWGIAFADHDCSTKAAQCGEKEGSHGCPIIGKIMKKAHFLLENKEEIGLSEEQVSRIKAIKLQTKKNSIRQEADMNLFMLDMNAKLDEPTVDVVGITAMMDQGMIGMAQGGKASVQAYADLKSVLTEEQKVKAKAIWNKK